MAAGDTYQKLSANDQLIINAAGNVVGLRNGHASGADLYFDPSNAAITGGVIDGQPIIAATMLPKWRKALADVLSGSGRGRILFMGDSTTAGSGSVAGLAGPGVKNGSYVNRFATLLSAMGISAVTHSAFGDAGFGASLPTYDTRIVMGSWTLNGGITSPGGSCFYASGTTASALSFTPTGSTDSCEIYYATSPTTGAFNANVNGGSNTLINTVSGSNGVSKATITGTLGANTYNFLWASGGAVFIFGWIAYDSTAKQVSVVNIGQAGATAAQIASAPWQGAAAHINAIAPNLTSIQIGINDWLGGTALSSYSSTVQSLLAAATAAGDCIVMSPLSSTTTSVSAATQAQYITAKQALAKTSGVPYIDTNYRWGNSFATANANGMYYSDGVHPSASGYADEARLLAKLLSV